MEQWRAIQQSKERAQAERLGEIVVSLVVWADGPTAIPLPPELEGLIERARKVLK